MGCELSRHFQRGRKYEVKEDATYFQPSSTGYGGAATEEDSKVYSKTASKAAALPQTKAAKLQAPVEPAAVDLQKKLPATKPKLDPKDFMFMNLQQETRVKLPGSVNGQQFIIDGCKDCYLFVMDHCASVTIDDCINCRIFFGPTEASIFMRNCSGCRLAAITRQLRCRDCTDCSILLLSRTRPIIESSSNMAFGCYDMPYAGLASQMAAAQLSPFHNFWSDVYDFTPPTVQPAKAAAGCDTCDSAVAKGNGSSSEDADKQQQHWSLLPAAATVRQLLGNPDLPVDVQHLLLKPAQADPAGERKEGAAQTAVPQACKKAEQAIAGCASAAATEQACIIRTHGFRHAVQGESCGADTGSAGAAGSLLLFVLFPVGCHDAALQWIAANFKAQQEHITENALDASSGNEAACTTAAAANCCCSPAAASPVRPVLLHTNEATVPGALLDKLAKVTGWNKQQLKQLGLSAEAAATSRKRASGNHSHMASSCVGLEIVCPSKESRDNLSKSAQEAGAVCCDSTAAAKLFRCLGVDG